MASYKSHPGPPRRHHEPMPYSHRAPTTRLPQRSVTPTLTTTPQPTSSTYSKLQKKRPTRDEQVHTSKGITVQRVPASKPLVVVKGRQGSTPTEPQPQVSARVAAPATVRQTSSSRLPKLDVPGNTRTPSLVSGSSASTIDSPRSNLLRRKPTSIGVPSGNKLPRTRAETMSSQEEGQQINGIPGGYRDPFSETVLGITLPPSSSNVSHVDIDSEPPETRYLDFELAPNEVLPLPTPQYALSTTPSTRYSESPGPFSVSSTPTSMSSYSPGAPLSATKSSARVRQASPLQSRPPVTRHRIEDETSVRQHHGLSSVRESSTSSSSTSTVLAELGRQKDKHSPGKLPAPPPSPPMHISSVDFSLSTNQAGMTQAEAARGKTRSSSRTHQVGTQAPPELAHLADPLPTSLPESRRPRRPSRDGMAEIVGLREPSPIIQSNMTSFPSSHKRTSSSDSKIGIVPTGRNRFGMPSKSSSRGPSPSPSLTSNIATTSGSRVPTRAPTPDVQGSIEARSKTIPVTAPSPSKSSRFGFFTRRAKTEPPAQKTDKKLHRRGPAAGTGHEGYGKYATRGRSGSSASGTSIGRSASAGTTSESLNHTPSSRKSSMTSTTSTEMDDFFLERLTPVIIRGAGSSAELTRSPEAMHSGSSLDITSSAGESKASTRIATRTPLDYDRPTLLPSAMSDPVRAIPPGKRMPLALRRPSESDDDTHKKSFLPALASRRTSRTAHQADGALSTNSVSGGSKTNKGRKGSDVEVQPKKADKTPPKPTKKWNFFQRALGGPRAGTPMPEVALAAGAPASRSMAHYALPGASLGIDLEEIEQIMQEADSTPEEPVEQPNVPANETSEEKGRLQSMLLPPKPILPPDVAMPARSASPKVYLRPEVQPDRALRLNTNVQQESESSVAPPLSELTPVTDLSPSSSPFRPLSPVETAVSPVASNGHQAFAPPMGPPPSNPPPPRPSRLQQVGRIPQVVSRRNRERRPSSQSFSRPFVADQPRPHAQSRTSVDSSNLLLATAGPAESYPVLQGLDALTHGSAIATLSPSAAEASRQSEFFKFPPRKNSEASYSSSSGVWSFAPASGTAVVPVPGAPQSEDEIWKEYDDLIDEVLLPIDPLAEPSWGTEEKRLSKRRPSLEPLPLRTKGSHSSNKSSGSVAASNASVHLRRSRLLAVLHEAQSPTSPLSLSQFLQGYGERNLSVVDPVTGRLSFPSNPRMSAGSGSKTRPGSTRSSLPASLSLSARQSKATLASNSDRSRESGRSNKYRDTRLMEMAESESNGPASMANLRFGALMTSKWLSFGRVLFSPAHFELKDPAEDRVLVIDGLGKDWSYYCALTYPEATVYNIGPGASSLTSDSSTAEPWSTLSNHRHISHPSLASPFPFPRGFFACVVLRFPPALSSAVHRFIVAECKRVLRPGGHLELSVLDLDLVNMGNRARRAVRGLKVKMQVADGDISLRNISDEIMAGLGRKGFTECNRCFVGVPVAGRLPGPDDTDAPDGKKRKGSIKTPKPEVSFSDLLNAQSSSDSADDSITDMVARVGRWWYSRCYESLVLPEAGEPGAANSGTLLESSIWRDESLIKECEKRGTSFRLLIGYAQKPEVGVRRTVSV